MVIIPVVKKIGPIFTLHTSKEMARSSKKRVACLTHNVGAIYMSGTLSKLKMDESPRIYLATFVRV